VTSLFRPPDEPRSETGEASFYFRASPRFEDGHGHYVCVLLCGDGHLYTGYSSNLRERVRQHERGEVFSTKSRRPVRLIFYEALFHAADAKRRERYLKTTAGKRALRLILRRFFQDRDANH